MTGSGLQWVTFQRIAFEHDNWVVPPNTGYGSLRQDTGITDMISCVNCQHVTFDTDVITQTAGGGIDFETTDPSKSTSRNTIQNSTLSDFGGTGIRIGLPAVSSDTDNNVPQFTTVYNNLINGVGRVIATAIPIVQGDGHDNTYSQNEILDSYHSGIELCQVRCPVGKRNSKGAFNNIFSFNLIYGIGQGVTDDMGCLYASTAAASVGNQFLNNICHDVNDALASGDADGYGGDGI